MAMLLINFAHPLTPEQVERATALLGEAPDVRSVPAQVDRQHPLAAAAQALADAVGLSPEEWQLRPLLVNPPALAPLALALISELHGRCGYFPPILNIRPVEGALPPRYELAEIVNLQALREAARGRRI